MGEIIGHYLQRPTDIGLYSVGADIIHQPYGPEYVRGGLYELRNNTLRLRASKHPNDVDAVTNINRNFLTYDHTIATRKLNHKLREPIGKDILEWMAYAPSRDVEMFCRWSLMRTHQLTRALNRDLPSFIDTTLNKSADLVAKGLFPPFSMQVIEAATERYYVQGMDTFYRGGLNAVGFCGDNIIAMANRYISPKYMQFASSGMKKTMFHEYLHGAGKDRGFFWGMKTALPVARILEEAFVEHASVVAFSPAIAKNPFVVHPEKRHGSWTRNSTYRPERTFMAKLIEHTTINLEHLSEAYFRPRGDDRGEWLREDIERKIGRFFGSRQAFFQFIDEYEITSRDNRPGLVHGKIRNLTDPSAA